MVWNSEAGKCWTAAELRNRNGKVGMLFLTSSWLPRRWGRCGCTESKRLIGNHNGLTGQSGSRTSRWSVGLRAPAGESGAEKYEKWMMRWFWISRSEDDLRVISGEESKMICRMKMTAGWSLLVEFSVMTFEVAEKGATVEGAKCETLKTNYEMILPVNSYTFDSYPLRHSVAWIDEFGSENQLGHLNFGWTTWVDGT